MDGEKSSSLSYKHLFSPGQLQTNPLLFSPGQLQTNPLAKDTGKYGLLRR
jgi:hypothetical protein